jgi:NADH dehydrogenase
MQRIVVLGGSGFVGSALCEQLVRKMPGVRVVVPTRRLRSGCDLRALPGVEFVQANVNEDAALQRCLRSADAVVNLVAILHGSPAQFDKAHVMLPRRLAGACAAHGIKRVVHVSALGVGAQASSNYLRSKTAGEAVLKAAPLELTVLRPSVIFGAHDRFLNLFAQMQALAPFVPLACADARFQPVWVGDVAQAIVRCLQDRNTIGKTFECTGPTVYTLADLVRLAGHCSGHERGIIALPGWAGRLQALLMEWLPGEPLMSRDNLRSMASPNVAGGELPGLEALGIEPAAPLAVAPTYLGQDSNESRFNRWRALR